MGGFTRYKGTPVVVDTHGSHSQGKKVKKKTIQQVIADSSSAPETAKKTLKEAESRPPPKKAKNWKHFFQWEKCHDNDHLGKDHHEVEAHLEKHYPLHDIEDHFDSVNAYTTASRHLNRSLLKHYESGETTPLKIHEHNIANLDKATGHHKLKHDLHVYSGVGFHPGEKASECPDNTIHLPAYTSASLCKKTATVFSHALPSNSDKYDHEPVNHVLHFHLKKGQKGLYVGRHSGYDNNEYEYILPRHTTVKVHPKPSIVPEGGHIGNDYKTYVWHAHVVANQDQVAKPGQKKPTGPKPKKS